MSEETIQQMAGQLFRERVREARDMAPEEKFLAGEELFEHACSITLSGIRYPFPGASEEECLRILQDRLAAQAAAENRR